jgi:hypothetical protein
MKKKLGKRSRGEAFAFCHSNASNAFYCAEGDVEDSLRECISDQQIRILPPDSVASRPSNGNGRFNAL